MTKDNKNINPQSDEELLILSEDSNEVSDLISSENKETSDELVLDGNTEPEKVDLILTDDKFSKVDSNGDSNLLTKETEEDLISFSEDDTTETKKLEEKKSTEEETLDMNFSTDDLDEKLEVGSMEEILADTISSLQTREAIIQKNLDKKEEHIKELEKELDGEKKEVSSLTGEQDAINKNIKALEKMKSEKPNNIDNKKK